ncbi:NAD(P)/FAD-dependent oxidoreductase [Pseudalkalibacillus berkeleyi]|uniref:NAD(P)/FAD-dependent oxidoreductase n=1 Tax=Pseudalkalibacillus berkeleyi TaxID=1069813 RepID=A0ABS9H4J5_9BACL|nr:NAD(P)/FAD-dependent oxidoreductase [Pseudalkalibacillus berkeleyi]MCF6139001.1 NAD(P)/FAD-dependent oxidoreductase [Pseudalkalibacillus berkeleyi]
MITKDILIIGGGPAGISASIWCQRLDLDYLLIEENDELGGQLKDIHNRIIDYPGKIYENGMVLQHQFTDHVKELDCKYHLKISIKSLDHESRTVLLNDGDGEMYIKYKYIIFATGTSVRRLEIPGEQEMILRGEIYSATKDRHRFQEKNVVVVGGGDRAFEGALLLAESGANVFLVHRSKSFRAREAFKNPVRAHSKITVLEDTVVRKIYHGDKGITGLDLFNLLDQSTSHIIAEGVFIRIGVQPNTRYLKKHVHVDEENYVVVNNCQQTSDSSIYAIGDVCTHPVFSSISSATSQGMIAAKHLSLRLS